MERAAAGQQLVQNHAERKDVGAVVRLETAHLFWRHVPDRAHHDAGRGDGLLRRGVRAGRVAFQLGQAEVQNLDAVVMGDENVLRLQVAMDDAFFVRRGQTAGDLNRVVDRLARGDRTVCHPGAKLVAFDELGDDIGHPRAVGRTGADVVDDQDVRMVERGGGACLLLEPLQSPGVAGQGTGQDLDGDVAVQARVPRPIHFAHAANAKR